MLETIFSILVSFFKMFDLTRDILSSWSLTAAVRSSRVAARGCKVCAVRLSSFFNWRDRLWFSPFHCSSSLWSNIIFSLPSELEVRGER